MKKRRKSDPNESILESLLQGRQRLIDAGLSEDDALREANQALLSALESSAPDLADSVTREGRRFVRQTRRHRRGFEKRLHKHWGEALDLLLIQVGMAEDAGQQCDARNRPRAAEQNDVLFEALTRMNAQACRITLEVHALLSAGFPSGALARSRSLHEVSVRAQVLAAYGRDPAHADLAERYLLHDHVVNYKDALTFQKHADRLGEHPFPDAEIENMKAVHDELVQRYGADYRSPYGWASGLPGLSRRPTFEELERLAEIDHLRGHYSWASHEVHADSKALRLNMMERAGAPFLLTGATNTGLAEPGGLASIYLHQTLVTFLYTQADIAHYDLLVGRAMQIMVDRINAAFGAGQARVDRAEETLQTRLARRGRRMDPVKGVVRL